LGLPQTATERQIKKRFRDLSLKYHPDKTGNDLKKKEFFMKLQGAMEVITKGTFDGPSNENAMHERLMVGFRFQGSGFRVQGSGFRVQGSGFRVQGSGFRVQGSGFRVQALGFEVCNCGV
jgi:curved DNA-binding protein CbpA